MSDGISHCANCEAPLTGPYCAQCGQHAHESARSMGALLHDGWHSLTHLDGRLWHTLWLLLRRPGELSRQYMANRRARFLPPFRLYLIVSLMYFAMAGLTDSGTFLQIRLDETDTAEQCQHIEISPTFLQKRIQRACERMVADGGKSLRGGFMASLPRAMFLFLPLIAGALWLLYWRPRRHYVEHLVFFLHAHAAAFLVGTAVLLVVKAGSVLPWFSFALPLLMAAVYLWLAFYIYFAMRRFYGQGRLRTLLKYSVLGVVYLLALVWMIGLTALFSAATL
jgi:hypothetical protein